MQWITLDGQKEICLYKLMNLTLYISVMPLWAICDYVLFICLMCKKCIVYLLFYINIHVCSSLLIVTWAKLPNKHRFHCIHLQCQCQAFTAAADWCISQSPTVEGCVFSECSSLPVNMPSFCNCSGWRRWVISPVVFFFFFRIRKEEESDRWESSTIASRVWVSYCTCTSY